MLLLQSVTAPSIAVPSANSMPVPSPTTEPAALVVVAQSLTTQPATTQPATRPATTRPVTFYDTARGDIGTQVKEVIEHVGLSQTIMQTPAAGWFMLALCLFAGLLAARLVASLVSRAGIRAAARVKLFRAVLLNSFVGPIGLLLFILGFGVGLTFITLSPPLMGALGALFQLLNLLWIGWLLYNLVDLITLILARWSRGRQGNLSVMLVPLARKTLRVMLVTVLLLFAADNIFQQDVKALLAGLGIAGLAVSLAAQDTIRNLFGSIMIFADQPFAIGDKVKVLDQEGKVEDIGFRSTRIRTLDGYVATIPNGNIASAAVLNLSRRSVIRRTLDVTLPQEAPPEQMSAALKLLREIVADPRIAAGLDPKRPPQVTFDEPSLRRARMVYWFRSSDKDAYLAHAELLNLAIMERFHRAGIAFK